MKPGDIVDSWCLKEKLGAGGNAEVWVAERPDRTESALKILGQIKPTKEPYRRFRAEIEVLRMLGSFPGILPLIDAHLPDQPSRQAPAWLALPIATLIRSSLENDASLRQVVEAMASVARTLAILAAEHGVYHRDIKPENLYQYNHNWCIGDFGLIDYPDKESLTGTGKFVGPIYYLAPELLNDPDNTESGPADVYSLAKTLWVLATGQNYPLPGFLSRQIPQFLISSYISDSRSHMLDLLVEKATHPNPRERPTMKDVADELAAWLEEPPSTSHIPDLSDLQGQITPIMQRYLEAKKRLDQYSTRACQLQRELPDRMQPITDKLSSMMGLPVTFINNPNIVSFAETKRIKQLSDHFCTDTVNFVAQSPLPLDEHNRNISLYGGIVIQFTRAGMLYITGFYILGILGAHRTLWVETQAAEVGTAREAKAIDYILNVMTSSLPTAISEYVDALRMHNP